MIPVGTAGSFARTSAIVSSSKLITRTRASMPSQRMRLRKSSSCCGRRPALELELAGAPRVRAEVEGLAQRRHLDARELGREPGAGVERPQLRPGSCGTPGPSRRWSGRPSSRAARRDPGAGEADVDVELGGAWRAAPPGRPGWCSPGRRRRRRGARPGGATHSRRSRHVPGLRSAAGTEQRPRRRPRERRTGPGCGWSSDGRALRGNPRRLGCDVPLDGSAGSASSEAQVPKTSTVCSTEEKPCSAATFSAHRSTAGPSTSTVVPQLTADQVVVVPALLQRR